MSELENVQENLTLPSKWRTKRSIGVVNRTGINSQGEKNHGKWTFPVKIDDIDRIWGVIRECTVKGEFWKCSRLHNVINIDPRTNTPEIIYHIAVYTYDQSDEADISRIKEKLMKIEGLAKNSLDYEALSYYKQMSEHENDHEVCTLPSKWTTERGIRIINRTGQNSQDEKNLGKWAFPVKIDDIDRIWGVIREGTVKGEFWKYSELDNDINIDPKTNKPDVIYHIAVYTYDRTDETDVSRIKEKLLQIEGLVKNNLDYETESYYEQISEHENNHEDFTLPSKWTIERGIRIINRTGQNSQDEKNLGKWAFPVKINDIDRIWGVIREGTVKGEFWKYSELDNDINLDPRTNKTEVVYHIAVYTYDRTDEADLSRIKEKLIQIEGLVKNNLDYKAEISYDEQIKFKPTTCTDQHWIYAKNKSDQVMKEDTPKTGKWLIFRKFEQIDEVWEKVKNAVEQGLLWRSAKVSTIKDFEQNPRTNKTEVVYHIAVYTYDESDKADVSRIKEKLLQIEGLAKNNLEYEVESYYEEMSEQENSHEVCTLPSKWTTERGIRIINRTEQNSQDEKNLGKWAFPVKIDDIDRIWGVIREGTVKGEFWKYSELDNDINIDPRTNKTEVVYHIAVYTYDRTDETDVSRIKEKLIQIEGLVKNNLDYEAEISYDEQIKFKPTTCTDQHWIYAKNKSGREMKEDTPKCGKWLIFRKFEQIDEVWEKIKNAVEQGLLWSSAKVSTIKDFEQRDTRGNTFVICVYTYDWRDDTDVYRIRRQLRTLGVYEKIKYKSDEDTLNGVYKVNLQKGQKIAKYYA